MNNINKLYLLFLFFLKIFSQESPHTPQELCEKITPDSYTYTYEYIKNIYEYEYRLKSIFKKYKYFSHISYIESIDSNYSLREFENELYRLLNDKFIIYNIYIFIVLIKKNSQVIIIIDPYYEDHLKSKVRVSVFREYIKTELKRDSIDYVFDYTTKQLKNSFGFYSEVSPGRNYLYAIIWLSITLGLMMVALFFGSIIFCARKSIENNKKIEDEFKNN
jgi:hypothetical protein